MTEYRNILNVGGGVSLKTIPLWWSLKSLKCNKRLNVWTGGRWEGAYYFIVFFIEKKIGGTLNDVYTSFWVWWKSSKVKYKKRFNMGR